MKSGEELGAMGALSQDRANCAETKPVKPRKRHRLSAIGSLGTQKIAALGEAELLSILLGEGSREDTASGLCRRLLERYGSLGGLSRCSVEELTRMRGIGPAKATQLLAAFGLANRICTENLRKQRIDSPERIFQLLGFEMRTLSKESLRVVLLDTRYQLMRVEEISSGTVNESIAHPRDIFAPLFMASAYAFVLVHNHPSGDPTPSEADKSLTSQLGKISKLLQVHLLDHVILGSADNGRAPWFSFKQAGFL